MEVVVGGMLLEAGGRSVGDGGRKLELEVAGSGGR